MKDNRPFKQRVLPAPCCFIWFVVLSSIIPLFVFNVFANESSDNGCIPFFVPIIAAGLFWYITRLVMAYFNLSW